MAQSKVVEGSDSDKMVVRHDPPYRKEEFIFCWKITNFKDLYAAAKSSEGKEITRLPLILGKTIGVPSNWEFQLRIDAEGLATELKFLEFNNLVEFRTIYKLYLKPENGEYDIVTSRNWFQQVQSQPVNSSATFHKFKALEELQEGGFLSNGELQLKLEIGIIISQTPLSATETQLKRDLSWDFKNGLETGVGADVTFTFVEGEGSQNVIGKTKAHSQILSLRSSVFATMFGSGMKEAIDGEVTICDMTPKSFGILLKFLYSGDVDEEWKSVAEELLHAADKYDLKVLQSYLSRNIDSVLTVRNVWRIRELAKLYNLPKILESTMNFIKKNTEDFVANIRRISFNED